MGWRILHRSLESQSRAENRFCAGLDDNPRAWIARQGVGQVSDLPVHEVSNSVQIQKPGSLPHAATQSENC